MKPTDGQIKEFWGRYGFEYRDYGEFVYGPLMHGGKVYEKAWFAPNGDNWLDKLPEPDLNNLWKYAMVTLDQANYYKALKSIFVKQKDPALALFWAIYGGKK